MSRCDVVDLGGIKFVTKENILIKAYLTLSSLAPYPQSQLAAIWVKGHEVNIQTSKSILLHGMLRSTVNGSTLHLS